MEFKNYTAKEVRQMFDDAESQPYVQLASLKTLSRDVVEHSITSGGDWQRTRMILVNQLIKDLLYDGKYNANDIRELTEECIEEVNAYNQMVKEEDV